MRSALQAPAARGGGSRDTPPPLAGGGWGGGLDAPRRSHRRAALRAAAAALADRRRSARSRCWWWRSPRSGARAARCWRLAGFAVLLLWLAGPRLVQESRDNLARYRPAGGRSVRLDAGRRPRAPGRGGARRARPSRRRSCPISNSAPSPCRRAAMPARACSRAIDRALADIPRSRLAGTIAITDGQVHDIPDTAAGRRAAQRADPGEGRGDRPPPARDRGAQLRHRRQDGHAARRHRGSRRGAPRRPRPT